MERGVIRLKPISEVKKGMLVVYNREVRTVSDLEISEQTGKLNIYTGTKAFTHIEYLTEIVVEIPTDLSVRSASMGTMLTYEIPVEEYLWGYVLRNNLIDTETELVVKSTSENTEFARIVLSEKGQSIWVDGKCYNELDVKALLIIREAFELMSK